MLKKQIPFKNIDVYCVLRGFFEVRLFSTSMNTLCRTQLKRLKISLKCHVFFSLKNTKKTHKMIKNSVQNAKTLKNKKK